MTPPEQAQIRRSPRVTICVYDKPDNVGGPVTWIQHLLPGLRQRGISVKCLFLLHWGDTGPAMEYARKENFEFDAILASPTTEERVTWILNQLAADPPDVFVPNLVIAGYFAGRWVRAAGIPTVGVLHSDDEFYRAIQTEFVFGKPEYRVTTLVCVSSQLEADVRSRHPDGVSVSRIPYGVEIPERSVSRDNRPFRLAYVGRLAEEQKRISDVTRALCRATHELEGTEAVLYGEGPDRDLVTAILDREGLGLPVWLGGLIPAAQIQSHLMQCDVIVLLSDYEGLPVALLEGMACGCVPVCLQMQSGIPELVEHGVTGLIVKDRNRSFIDAIRTLRDDPELWQRLSAAARSRVSSRFSLDASNDTWASMLHEMALTPSKSRILIPSGLHLPPPRAPLESRSDRQPKRSVLIRMYSMARRTAGALKRHFFASRPVRAMRRS